MKFTSVLKPYYDQLKKSPYRFITTGEIYDFKSPTKSILKKVVLEVTIKYILDNFSPYPNYRFKDFLNSTYYTWYDAMNSEKDKVKKLFNKQYIDNYEDAAMFLRHLNTIFMLSGTYPFILKFINEKTVSKKSTFQKIVNTAGNMMKSPCDRDADALDDYLSLAGLPDANDTLGNDELSNYMQNAYRNKEDIFLALSRYESNNVLGQYVYFGLLRLRILKIIHRI